MEKTQQSFNAAHKDVRLNNIPSRLPDGRYMWSQGQSSILCNTEHSKIRLDRNSLLYLQEQEAAILKEMLVYQSVSEEIKAEIDNTAARHDEQIEERASITGTLNNDLKQFEEGMHNRGIMLNAKPGENKEEIGFLKNIFTASTGKKIKSVLIFLISWLVGEIFMTAVSWQTLRNDNNIESIVIRSMALGMVILLIHVAGHLNKRRKKPIYIIYISFSLLMLLSMLFAPMVINKIYPENNSPVNSTQWSFSDAPATNITTNISQAPTWVEIYRGNEITVPAILCLVFFLAIMAFTSINKEEDKSVENQKGVNAEEAETNRQRNQLITHRNNSMKIEEELKLKKKEEILKNTIELNNILKKLEESEKRVTEIDKQITALNTNIEIQLVLIEKELDQYKIDFEDILRNDVVKASFVTPEWSNRQDILNFFKIK